MTRSSGGGCTGSPSPRCSCGAPTIASSPPTTTGRRTATPSRPPGSSRCPAPNPLPTLRTPTASVQAPGRVAEEMAMVDVSSGGRLECGFVRGVPYEMSAGTHRPAHMMARFWEAHDLIVKAWTSHDGPFNWEGKYFHHRQVNIWPRPYQEPHPPI